MCDRQSSTGTLLTGLAIGAAVGAGLIFLFGTKKGREVREKVRDQYPEFFDKLDDALGNIEEGYGQVAEMSSDTKEAVSDKVADLGKAVEKLGKELEKASPPKPHLFRGIKRSH